MTTARSSGPATPTSIGFFHKFAGQNQFRHYVGVTYVAVADRRILGFATVAPGRVETDELPVAARKKLPRYALPVLRLARLAVDQSAQGQGLGAQLLQFVLQLALRMAGDYGCAGVVVDAKPDAMEFLRQIRLQPDRGGRGPVRRPAAADSHVPLHSRHQRGASASGVRT